MAAAKSTASTAPEIRNAKAGRDYHLGDRFEAGIALTGTEVKSIRNGKAQLAESYGRCEKGQMYIYNLHIAEYAYGNINNHMPTRPRKLLLKRREIDKIRLKMEAGGMALVPVRMYFKTALVKVELALGVGKKQHDKREDLKKRVEMREADREMRQRR